MVYLSKSKLSIAILGNLGFALSILAYRLITLVSVLSRAAVVDLPISRCVAASFICLSPIPARIFNRDIDEKA